MKVPASSIFKQYDIRGVADTELTDDLVIFLGRAVGTYLLRHDKDNVVVGRDGRLSGENYRDRFIDGLISTGIQVVDIGLCPTPVVYFAIHHRGAGGGVAITASHNPPQYNGFKVCCGTETIFGEQIQVLRRLVETGDFESGAGSLQKWAATPVYQDYLRNQFDPFASRLRVVVDAGNGTAGLVAPELLRSLHCRVIELYCNVDGHFPNHEADPTVGANLQDLIRVVREQNADLGIAFDGDGDRIGVVDATGHILHGDQLLLLYAVSILARQPGATIISEVKASRVLFDEIRRRGGNGIMWKTGHSLIKAKMRESGAQAAGEMSGHMFFADRYFGYDDAIYAACRLLEIMDQSGTSLQRLREEQIPPACNTPEIRVDCPEDQKAELIRALGEYYRRDHEVNDIDGVRVSFPGGWGLVRASNTQPLLVLRFEADTPDRLREIQTAMTAMIDTLKQGVRS